MVSAAIQLEAVNPPAVVNNLGSMGIVGEYEGISQYQYSGQQTVLTDPYFDSVIAQVNNAFLNQGTSNGRVSNICQINETIYLSGNFTKIGSTNIPNGLAKLNASSGDIESLGNDLNGTIHALYCDAESKTIYVGGNFTYKNQTGAAVYNSSTSSWSVPLFGGFPSGSNIKSIVSYNDSIVYGGSFSGLANTSLVSSSTGDNSTLLNSQQISFNLANIFGDGTASNNDPKSIICPSDSSDWAMEPNRVGSWNVIWPFYFNPTVLKLYNLKDENNGVSIFRVRSFPNNGIMNLTYVNTTTNTPAYCDAWCTLPKSSKENFVEFSFVNTVGMNGLQIEILDYYGTNGGLNGIELFQNDAFTFANQSYNMQNSCDNNKFAPASTLNGNFASPDVSESTYITAQVDQASQISETAVIYQPNISLSGNYTFLLFTPGCLQDGSCNTRGGVNVTIEANQQDEPTVLSLYETNLNNKYDTIYTGKVDQISDGFRPKITITPLRNQQLPLTFVADKLQVVLNSVDAKSVSISSLFEYNAKNFTKGANVHSVGNTTINFAGSLLGKSATVNALHVEGNTLYVGGNFTTKVLSNNLFKIESGSLKNVSGNGLNGVVNGIENYNSDELLVYGKFTRPVNSQVNGTSNVALYHESDDEWAPLGHGTNGEVLSTSRFDLNGTYMLGISGNFSQVYSETSSISAENGFSLWVPSQNSWFADSSLSNMFLQARVSASASFNGTNFYAGFVRYFQLSSSGATFVDSGFSPSSIPFSFASSDSSNSTLQRRNSILGTGDNTINAGAFANSSFSILAGHFNAEADGLIYSNLIMINDNKVKGLPNNTIDKSSVFHQLYVRDNILYAGGQITGQVNSNSISGLVFYDLTADRYTSSQPAGISGGQEIVTCLQARPNSDQLIVAGSFQQVGGLTCSSFCVYDLGVNRWYSPSPGLSGLVSSMEFIGGDLVLFAGDITLNNTQVYFTQYNFKDSSFNTFGNMSTLLPGPVNSFALNGNGISSVFASGLDSSSGNPYISHWDGSNWNRIDSVIQPGSMIADIAVMELENEHNSNSVLPNNQVLLVSGNLVLQDFGNASSVFFDGSSWQPAFITTKADGTSGSVNSFFSQSSKSYGQIQEKKYMKRGFVVLIALAIAVGLTFMLVALGLLIAYIRRKRQGYEAPSRVSETEMAETIPPATLFEEMSHAKPRTTKLTP
jgi:hypothetical protein